VTYHHLTAAAAATATSTAAAAAAAATAAVAIETVLPVIEKDLRLACQWNQRWL